ncbi:hypothetical protein F5887DRAFT_933271 [Amanita rubescens]|nr:hypothetical protein F5887DRAFT_933271 [Amanita rubescens]
MAVLLFHAYKNHKLPSYSQHMNSYSADMEQGEIREFAPAPILSYNWDYRRGAGDAPHQDKLDYGSDDDSIRSSRPCTPPGLTISKKTASVPGAPRPKPPPRAATTTPDSPSPAPQSRWPRASLTSSAASMYGTDASESPSIGRDARGPTRWTIPPDVYRKAESALARLTAMSKGPGTYNDPSDRVLASGAEGLRYSPEQVAAPTSSYCCATTLVPEKHREPPRSPLSPEELERAIGIIEDLFIVDGVPPHVFIQCGVSPGTLYHAFNHLGLKLPDDFW